MPFSPVGRLLASTARAKRAEDLRPNGLLHWTLFSSLAITRILAFEEPECRKSIKSTTYLGGRRSVGNMQPTNHQYISNRIELRPHQSDRALAESHDHWARKRIDEGWRYGPRRDDSGKAHPDKAIIALGTRSLASKRFARIESRTFPWHRILETSCRRQSDELPRAPNRQQRSRLPRVPSTAL
jgi:hypothetical protein